MIRLEVPELFDDDAVVDDDIRMFEVSRKFPLPNFDVNLIAGTSNNSSKFDSEE